jgi:hypothetical protein
MTESLLKQWKKMHPVAKACSSKEAADLLVLRLVVEVGVPKVAALTSLCPCHDSSEYSSSLGFVEDSSLLNLLSKEHDLVLSSRLSSKKTVLASFSSWGR